MDFGQAIEAARSGKKITRAGWNGKGQWVCFMPPMTVPAELVNERTRAHVGNGKHLICGGYFTIARACPDGFNVNWQPGWLASQADMLADDWHEVE